MIEMERGAWHGVKFIITPRPSMPDRLTREPASIQEKVSNMKAMHRQELQRIGRRGKGVRW